MFLSASLRVGAVLASVTCAAACATAAPPGGHAGGGRAGGHPGGAHPGGAHPGGVHVVPGGAYRPGYSYPSSGTRIVIGLGAGYGYPYASPLYSGLGNGTRYYGGLGYNSGYFGGSILPPYNYSVPYTSPYVVPYQTLPAQPIVDPGIDPTPIPLPTPAAGEASTAKVTVVTNEGAKVTFDGIESDQTGTRHSFTTRPIAPGGEIRVRIQVDGSTLSVGVKGGEKATVDMRK